MVLLDWEQAFDKIIIEGLVAALSRMNIDPFLINRAKDLYKAPRFQVVLEGSESSYYSQSSGIRQGCTLPP